jgi:hypothetical protein
MERLRGGPTRSDGPSWEPLAASTTSPYGFRPLPSVGIYC